MLAYLHQLPRWLLFLGVLAVGLVAIFAPTPFNAIALLVIAAFLGWLGYLSWPALTPSGRLVRVVALAVVIGAAIVTLRS